MVERKHLLKLKKFIDAGKKELDLTKNLLCTVALGEKLSPGFYKDRKIAQTLRPFLFSFRLLIRSRLIFQISFPR